MKVEQQFVDLIKEGNVADAMQLIKTQLSEMAGERIVDAKFAIAEGYGMKKMKKEDMHDDEDHEMEEGDKSHMKKEEDEDHGEDHDEEDKEEESEDE